MLLSFSTLWEKSLPHLSTKLALLAQMNHALKSSLPQQLVPFCALANVDQNRATIVVANKAIGQKMQHLKTRILATLKSVQPQLTEVNIKVSRRFLDGPTHNASLYSKTQRTLSPSTAHQIQQKLQQTEPDFKNAWETLLKHLTS